MKNFCSFIVLSTKTLLASLFRKKNFFFLNEIRPAEAHKPRDDLRNSTFFSWVASVFAPQKEDLSRYKLRKIFERSCGSSWSYSVSLQSYRFFCFCLRALTGVDEVTDLHSDKSRVSKKGSCATPVSSMFVSARSSVFSDLHAPRGVNEVMATH